MHGYYRLASHWGSPRGIPPRIPPIITLRAPLGDPREVSLGESLVCICSEDLVVVSAGVIPRGVPLKDPPDRIPWGHPLAG